MADNRDTALDAEGVPDLEGPLETKASTGDPQEGVPAPSNTPHSFMHGVTDNEQRRGESIATRVEHEQPDFGLAEVGSADDEPVVLIDDADDGIADLEKDLVAVASSDEPSLSAEEAAVHVLDEAPGGVDYPRDSYLDGA
jgi:hypothetical protein